jgi:hypothetical protein
MIFSLVACKKRSHSYFAAGNERNMVITEINKSIDIQAVELLAEQTSDINIDGTGINDVSFRCDHAYRPLDTLEIAWHIYIKILNDDFKMYKVGVDSYRKYSEYLADPNPEAPVIEGELIYTCEAIEGAESYHFDYFLESFQEGDKIDFKNYAWGLTHPYYNDQISIAKKDVEPVIRVKESIYYDTLIRTTTHYINSCKNEVLTNQKSYFLFEEIAEHEDEKNLGWIEYELTEDQFIIYRVAISDRSLRE